MADEPDGLAGVLAVAAAVAVAFQDVEDFEDEAPGQALVVGHVPLLFLRECGRVDVRGDAGSGGGFPAVLGLVAGDVEPVVIQGGGGAPVPGHGAVAGGGGRGALEAGAAGGAFVPPGVVQAGDGVAQLRADGAGLAADELADGHRVDAGRAGDAGRAVAHDVQGAQPQPGPGRVQPWRGAGPGWSP